MLFIFLGLDVSPFFVWMLVGMCLFLLEFAAPGLIVAFFGIGAIITAIITKFADISLTWQIFWFIFFSVASLVLLRNTFKKIFYGDKKAGELRDLDDAGAIGKIVTVTEKITPEIPGKVEFQGTSWSASADEVIEAGERVVIKAQENLMLTVSHRQSL
ncbi:MAG: NfeD family protein [Phycisphaerae bacterium]|jgi:membrane protein implicated in regulation of membrane protease activity